MGRIYQLNQDKSPAIYNAINANSNYRAPVGGIISMASPAASAVLTNQALGTDDFSVVLGLIAPAPALGYAVGIGAFSSSNTTSTQANALTCFIDATNNLHVRLYGGTTSDYNDAAVSLAPFVGTPVVFDFTRSGSTVTLYLNGVAQALTLTTAGTAPGWGGSVTSTYFNKGFVDASTPFYGRIFTASLYNLAHSATEAALVAQMGAGVPDAFKNISAIQVTGGNPNGWATTNKLTLAPVQGSWTTWSWDGVNTISASTANAGYTSGFILSPFQIKPGRYRVRYDLTLNSGVNPWFSDGNANNVVLTPGMGQVADFRWSANEMQLATISGATNFTITIHSLTLIGCLAYWPLDDGGGYQLADQSLNALHSIASATDGAVAHALARNGPFFFRASTSTNGNQQLAGALAAIPPNSRHLRTSAKALTGTPTVKLGSTSGGAQIGASVTLATNVWTDIPVVLTGGMTGASALALWSNSNSTDTVLFQLEWVPVHV